MTETSTRADGELDNPEDTPRLPLSLRYCHRRDDDPWRNTYAQALAEHRAIRTVMITETQPPGSCPRCWRGYHPYDHQPPTWINHGDAQGDGPPCGHHAHVLRLRAEHRADQAGTWRIEDHYDVPEPTNYDRVVQLLSDPRTMLNGRQMTHVKQLADLALGRLVFVTGDGGPTPPPAPRP